MGVHQIYPYLDMPPYKEIMSVSGIRFPSVKQYGEGLYMCKITGP